VRHDVVIWSSEPDSATSAEFAEFYKRRSTSAIGLAHLLTGSRAVGQDVAQEAFVVVHAKWATLTNPEAYLRTVVVNMSRSIQRRQIRERVHLGRTAVEAVTSIPAIDETWSVIKGLPHDQRTVIVLRFYEDMALGEIASLLDKPLGTVKSTIHRALDRLKDTLHD